MPACPPPGCQFIFDDPRVLISGTAFLEVQENQRCEQNILLLTDDPGLFDVTNAALGEYLSADSPPSRVKEMNSITEVGRHFGICSALYRDLSCFFRYTQRPPSVKVGFVDSANGETLLDAFQEIIKCPVCAWQVQTTTYKADGTTWIDTQEYLDFTNFVAGDDDWYHNGMTYQASTAFSDPFETASFAAQANAAGQAQEWTLADYSCDVERDANCDPILDANNATTPEFYYNNSGLGAAALKASYATTDADYNFSVFAEPNNGVHGCHTGQFLDETTNEPMDLGAEGQSGLANLTGLDSGRGSPIAGVTRHLNAFVNLDTGVRYISSLYVNGTQYGDVYFKQKAIDDSIRDQALDFQDNFSLAFDLKTARRLAAYIKFTLDTWVSKNVIDPRVVDWVAQGYGNILVNGQSGNGEGYVIYYRPLEEVPQADINNRAGFTLGVCFVVNTPQHGVTVQVCEIPLLLQNG